MAYMNLRTFEYGTDVTSDAPFIKEIDENIIAVISVLNKKGYTTMRSDEGHIERNLSDESPFAIITIPYISFVNGISLPSVPDGWAVETETVYYDEEANPQEGLWTNLIADMHYSSDNELEFYRKKMAALFSLTSWVESLPECAPAK